MLLVKTTIKNWFSQVHSNDQFFLVILTNLFLQCMSNYTYSYTAKSFGESDGGLVTQLVSLSFHLSSRSSDTL